VVSHENSDVWIGLVITLIAVLFTFLVQWLIEKKKTGNSKTKAIVGLKVEVLTNYTAVKNSPKVVTDTSLTTQNFRTLELNTDMYDSFLYSGLFREFDIEFQIKLIALYELVKSSNQASERLLDIMGFADADSEWFKSRLNAFASAFNIRLRKTEESSKGFLEYLKKFE